MNGPAITSRWYPRLTSRRPRCRLLGPAATQRGRDRSQALAHAHEHNERAAAHILLLHGKGLNYSQIAARLNALRLLARTGKTFRAEQVKRLYLRAEGATLK